MKRRGDDNNNNEQTRATQQHPIHVTMYESAIKDNTGDEPLRTPEKSRNQHFARNNNNAI